MQKSFKLKLLLVQILVIAPFLLIIFYLIDHWYDTQRSQILRSNLDYARLVAGYIKDYVDDSRLLAQSLTSDEDLIKNLDTKPATDINLQALSSKLDKIVKSGRKTVILFDRKGNIVLITGKGLIKEEDKTTLAQKKFIIDTLSGNSQFLENEMLPVISSGRFYGATVPISELGWGVLSVESAQDLFIPITSVQRQLWLIVILALVFSFAIYSYFLRKMRLVF